jgi:hypothetical protein
MEKECDLEYGSECAKVYDLEYDLVMAYETVYETECGLEYVMEYEMQMEYD